jgi:hypothetical protein
MRRNWHTIVHRNPSPLCKCRLPRITGEKINAATAYLTAVGVLVPSLCLSSVSSDLRDRLPQPCAAFHSSSQLNPLPSHALLAVLHRGPIGSPLFRLYAMSLTHKLRSLRHPYHPVAQATTLSRAMAPHPYASGITRLSWPCVPFNLLNTNTVIPLRP